MLFILLLVIDFDLTHSLKKKKKKIKVKNKRILNEVVLREMTKNLIWGQGEQTIGNDVKH